MNITRLTGRTRSPARPGPGDVADRLLRSLQLDTARRIDGLLAGDHTSSAIGNGTELAQIRPYVIGDDVRLIEWNATARTQTPHVRVDISERASSTWVVLDASPSMAFGTADRRKADVAEGVALTIAYLGSCGANRVGIASFGSPDEVFVPPASGRRALLGVLPGLRHDPSSGSQTSGSLARSLRRVHASARARGAVFVIADLIGPLDWRRPMLQLATRHDVVVVEVRDPREDELTDVGDTWFSDPETGRRQRVDTSDAELRERFAEAALAERSLVRRAVTSAGSAHVVLSTEGDWIRPFSTFLRMRRIRRSRR